MVLDKNTTLGAKFTNSLPRAGWNFNYRAFSPRQVLLLELQRFLERCPQEEQQKNLIFSPTEETWLVVNM